jgi:hypothetical protein
MEGPALLESSAVEPPIEGSADQPDVLVALEMLSFHLDETCVKDKDTRATMRVTLGKAPSSTDRKFETAFWSVAAGLDLYTASMDGKPKASFPKAYNADFRKAFGNRPIEVPGGLGLLTFQVVKHKEPNWWQRVFKFAEGGTGKALISVLGFPAITEQAISVIDQIVGRLTESEPEVLFQSMPMRLALSKWARDEFLGGSKRVTMGCLRRGFCVLARNKDVDSLQKANVIYNAIYGKLLPADATEEQALDGDDPLKNLTYAVFRVGTQATRMDPTFNFSS